MGHKRIGIKPTPMKVWEPLRVALAWFVTSGDNGFVDQARADRRYDATVVLAGCLADEMERAGWIKRPGPPGEAPTPGPRLVADVGADAAAIVRAAVVGASDPASSAISRVPQLPQNRAPATIGAPHVGQPMRFPHRTQNFASGLFSAVQFAQINVARL